jgi:hypothetical protein
MGCYIHDVLKKVIVYYTKKHKIIKDFWLWFEIVIILKDKTLNLQGINILSNFHIYSKIICIKGRTVLSLFDKLNESSEQERHIIPIRQAGQRWF